ncbi:MAG: cysteine synthase family protein [Bacteroidota bacterium]
MECAAQDPRSLPGRIGGTPLLRIRKILPRNARIEILAKAEWLNPGGSVKDRAALSMLLDAERRGALKPETIIIDATSGNTGIAYAMLGAAFGYHIALALPANASEERKQILRAYGAEVILTDPMSGTDGAQERVKEIVAARPDLYYYPDQYNNPANWRAHYETTGAEILEQTEGRVTHFIAGLGTTGTFVGNARRLKEAGSPVTCISFEPDVPLHGMEGLKHLETAITPGIYDPSLADEHLTVSTEEARAMTLRLAREEGLYVGVSSGAAMAACLRVASRLDAGVIVTVFPDGGTRYGGERFWHESPEMKP